MMRILFFIVVLFLGFAGCESNSSGEKQVEEIEASKGGRNADIIRNPVTADKPVDTVNVAKMVFEETAHNFGKIKQGAVVNHTFKFKNTGKVTLIITNAKSTCGCTIPEWPKDPIEPGKGGEIQVKFNSTNKENYQSKPITISANTYPSQTVLYMNGHVIAEKE